MNSKKLTVLVTPMDAFGHFYACIGLAEPLRDRGHNVVFAVPNGWKGKLEALGFNEESYSTEDKDADTDSTPAAAQSEAFAEIVRAMAASMAKPPQYQMEIMHGILSAAVNMFKNSEQEFKRIVSKVKPDVIIVDTVFCSPALNHSGIPWILSVSFNPLGITKENSPPPFFGLPILGDSSTWIDYTKTYEKMFRGMFQEFNSWVIENEGEPIEENYPFFMNLSPYGNIYMYPKELDYTDSRPTPPNWHQFDTFIRRESNVEFEIPEELTKLPGKLIYLSMGSLGCADVGLMERLVRILCKSQHRFIVSKGMLGDKYELPSNMWGANMVPQTKVLPLVDLVITHGGNNTVTEAFYFGKPCIVLPLFFDQHDNAQRIQELGFGLKFPPYQVTEEALLSAVDRILANEELTIKMQEISKRIQAEDSKSKAADLIENVALNNPPENNVKDL